MQKYNKNAMANTQNVKPKLSNCGEEEDRVGVGYQHKRLKHWSCCDSKGILKVLLSF